MLLRLFEHEAAFRPITSLTLFLNLAAQKFAYEHLRDETKLWMLTDNLRERASESANATSAITLLNLCKPSEILENLQRLLRALLRVQTSKRREVRGCKVAPRFTELNVECLFVQPCFHHRKHGSQRRRVRLGKEVLRLRR